MASSAVSEHVALSLEKSLLRIRVESRKDRARGHRRSSNRVMRRERRQADPPSTTVVAAIVDGVDSVIGWAGDSRAYWVEAGGEARQLTADHSWMNEVVGSRRDDRRKRRACPAGRTASRAGWEADAGRDCASRYRALQNSRAGMAAANILTDGLWNYAEDPAVLGHMVDSSDPCLDIAGRLIDFANQQGGHDNITAVLLRECPANDWPLPKERPTIGSRGLALVAQALSPAAFEFFTALTVVARKSILGRARQQAVMSAMENR